MRYAQALADWADAGGYEAETLWDVCTVGGARHRRSSGRSGARCARCRAVSRSGSRSRRCCAGRTRCCCSTSRTTTSTCPASAGSRSSCAATPEDGAARLARPRAAQPGGRPGSSPSSRGGRGDARGCTAAASRPTTRPARTGTARLEELRRRWDEEHAKIKTLVQTLQDQGDVQRRHGLAVPGRPDPAAKFEEAGPPQAVPLEQKVTMRLRGGRTGKRAVVCDEPRAHRA